MRPRFRRWCCDDGTACRVRRTTLGVSGSYWASPVVVFLSARQCPKGFSGDVTLETADDRVASISPRRGDAFMYGNGAGFVLAESSDHDPPDRVVGVSVAAAVEPEPVVDLAARRRDRGRCHTASPTPPRTLIRSGVVAGGDEQLPRRCRLPTPKMFNSSGAAALTSGPSCSSIVASSASRAWNRRARINAVGLGCLHDDVTAGMWAQLGGLVDQLCRGQPAQPARAARLVR